MSPPIFVVIPLPLFSNILLDRCRKFSLLLQKGLYILFDTHDPGFSHLTFLNLIDILL